MSRSGRAGGGEQVWEGGGDRSYLYRAEAQDDNAVVNLCGVTVVQHRPLCHISFSRIDVGGGLWQASSSQSWWEIE